MDPGRMRCAPRRRRAAVMSDVGRLAGVSHQTVSRVINGSPHVRPETRDRVLAAMRELDYRPNSVARALVTGRSRTLGVVSFDTTLYGPASTLFGIERAAHEAGYFIIVASLKALDAQSVTEAIERLRLQAVEGILVIAPDDDAAEALRRHLGRGARSSRSRPGPAQGIPVAWPWISSPALPAATRHLLELGHETVWHIGGPVRLPRGARARATAGATTLSDAGAPVHDAAGRRLERAARATSSASGSSGEPEATAIFVANDQMALGVLRALHEAGRAVPGEVSVVGFDDIPEAPYFTAAADHGAPGLRRDGQPRRAGCCCDRWPRGAGAPSARRSTRSWWCARAPVRRRQRDRSRLTRRGVIANMRRRAEAEKENGRARRRNPRRVAVGRCQRDTARGRVCGVS